MNVLLTCAGRCSYLVQFFKSALGQRGQVIVCDSSASAPAFMEADQSFVVPPVDDPDHFDVLASICEQQRVGLLISVHDFELAGLAHQAGRFRELGTIPMIASPSIVAMCQDKWSAYHFLKARDIPTPTTCASITEARRAIASGILKYPLIIKPRWGARSIGVELIENERDLTLAHEWGQVQLKRTIIAKMGSGDPEHSFVFQQRLDGQEYGLDIVNDLDGRHVATLARRKLVMRTGSTDRAISVSEPAFERLGEKLGKWVGHLGNLDCDVMASDGGFMVLDLNPRFGGGYPFSHLAGANLPAALIAWANDEPHDPSWLRCRPGVMSARYDGVTVIDRSATAMTACQHLPAHA